ncbi:copper chaperone PCu(A)C [Sphingoaurantiacus capsulatus]|uniref:Copper chaperone PCu(A)C n=1 Tax=Sphingoaurantiacus capsulatus TaxID=1771310 RepID=A0ABV7XE12_9SPHN
MKSQFIFAAAALGAAVPAAAQVSVDSPWLRETPPGAKAGAGYGLVINGGKAADRLLGGSTPVAARVEVHSMTMANGIMRMRPVAGGLAVPAGGSVALKPGGYHLMLTGLKQPLRRGAIVPVTLSFANAGAVRVTFRVEGIEHGQEDPHAGH